MLDFRSIALAFTVALCILLGGLLADAAASHASPVPCVEDAPCWVWSSMGNHKRSVTTLYGNVRVVGPCAFRRLWNAGHLRYSVRVAGVTYGHLLKHMKGDAYARSHGCER